MTDGKLTNRTFDERDEDDDENQGEKVNGNLDTALQDLIGVAALDIAAQEVLERGDDLIRECGDDAGEDHHRDTVADTFIRNLIA